MFTSSRYLSLKDVTFFSIVNIILYFDIFYYITLLKGFFAFSFKLLNNK